MRECRLTAAQSGNLKFLFSGRAKYHLKSLVLYRIKNRRRFLFKYIRELAVLYPYLSPSSALH